MVRLGSHREWEGETSVEMDESLRRAFEMEQLLGRRARKAVDFVLFGREEIARGQRCVPPLIVISTTSWFGGWFGGVLRRFVRSTHLF